MHLLRRPSVPCSVHSVIFRNGIKSNLHKQMKSFFPACIHVAISLIPPPLPHVFASAS
ncbi:uncharacterized protein EI90DRAFT_3081000 [Cantharellus anzutake]|uniref:uncharacterized protein n=1 Tax=Cantharellus anzutake TaxID=1750568 RepID=UPI0019075E42|nr:uncharacterized protein EI90DRAFT_3081000 [Cantharellus anzutake]KAF8320206.1 hypothetical protein EI90DRAFT_3081000 [Cantharellus anzutake]